MSSIAERKAQVRALWADSRWDDVATFIGPNAAKFEPVWQRTRDAVLAGKSPLVWSWSWPAFLFSFVWWAYRRQWWVAALLLILPVAIGFLVPEAGKGIAGASIVIPMLAKSSYIQLAVAKIAKINAAGGGTVEVAAAGGVSQPAAIGGGIILAAILLVYVAAFAATVFL